jgi:N-acetylglucosaminyldiphosphoundecaprenol N-acetyl-beta-D-mannosaminyltransferase
MPERYDVLGIGIDEVDYAGACDQIIGAARARRGFSTSALAVHGVMTGVLDAAHGCRLNRLDLVVPDGQPVRWVMNLLHDRRQRERVYGPNLMLELCSRAAEEELPIFLFGSRAEVLDRLEANLRRRFPGLLIAGTMPSRFRRLSDAENGEMVREIRASGAALVFVGLGCPRQEVWAFENRDALSLPAVAVGAAFDFHAGLLSQAPARLQRAGLEWLYRLWQEPRRLWKRYLYLNPLYIGLVLLQATGLRRFGGREASTAVEAMHYG